MIKVFNNYSRYELKNSGMSIGNVVNISKEVIFKNPHNIKIGNNVRIDAFSFIIAGEKTTVEIGNNIHISAGCYFYGSSGDIVLNDYSTISGRCTFYTANDDYTEGFMTNPTVKKENRNVSIGRIIIEKHTIIGCNSTVLPGVTLRYGTSVGAYSLVKYSTQPFDIICGIPAKIIKKRKNIHLHDQKG